MEVLKFGNDNNNNNNKLLEVNMFKVLLILLVVFPILFVLNCILKFGVVNFDVSL